MKTASEICEDAITILDERGWCRGELSDEQGRVCMVGALRAAAGYRPLFIDASRENNPCYKAAKQKVRDKISEFRPNNVLSIHRWNDEVATDKTDVQRVLMEAAKTLRDEGR